MSENTIDEREDPISKDENKPNYQLPRGKKCKFGIYWDLHKVGYVDDPYLYYDGMNSCRHEFATLQKEEEA